MQSEFHNTKRQTIQKYNKIEIQKYKSVLHAESIPPLKGLAGIPPDGRDRIVLSTTSSSEDLNAEHCAGFYYWH